MLNLDQLEGMSEAEIEAKALRDPEWFRDILAQLTDVVTEDRQATQLAYYETANPMTLPAHLSMAREVSLVGGNRSSKTDTMLAELSIQMTGHIPLSLQSVYPRQKLRAPIRARVVCNSLTDTLEPVIKPKLRYDQWNGVGEPSMGRGHWGWIPKHCLEGGTWEKAYSEKYRTLRVSVDNHWVGQDGSVNSMKGWSSCQFLSYDQDLSAFAGSSMHFVGHDELPPQDIYRENRIRTLDVRGQIYTAFTPPDEAGIQTGDVSYFFNEVYEPGLPGPSRNPHFETIILHTEKNRILGAEDIKALAATLTEQQREVRLLGRFIHLSGVIFQLFTPGEATWCFKCHKRNLAMDRVCPKCSGDDTELFSHVIEPFVVSQNWPVVMVIDPHPRKKDAIAWFCITPSDDVICIGELEADGTAGEVAESIAGWESAHRVSPVRRLMDPNIATETNDKLKRGWTIQQEYTNAGVECDLAVDNLNSGIMKVNELLIPDPRTRRPRLHVFNTCEQLIKSMRNWTWGEYSRSSDRDPKEQPRDKYKDFCDTVRYLANEECSYQSLMYGSGIIRLRKR